jgi:group II intron reverse transcriptase/maturase
MNHINNTNPLYNQIVEPQIVAEFRLNEIKLTNTQKRDLILSKGNKLSSLLLRNKNTQHINHSIYHLLLDPFTLDNAYINLSKNKGASTEGVVPGSIDGYSRTESITITKQLANRTYIPSPVRRVLIPKPGKKEKRPLGIPTFKDRVVQEAIRGILEAIYEPEFREFENKVKNSTNFGFRPKKSCWDAIEHFTTYGQKITFVIEGDIKGAYNNVSHKILLKLLSKRIKDKKFLELINKFLKAGIMEQGSFEHSIIGKGGILSPLLFNIYMFELDKFIYESIISKHTTPNPTQNKSKTYQRIAYKMRQDRIKYNQYLSSLDRIERKNDQTLKQLKQNLKESCATTLNTPSYDRSNELSMVYTRYADDWVLGIAGSLKLTRIIKEEIEDWLSDNLELKLSQEKTKITNIRKHFVPFLGYSITLRSNNRNIKTARVLTKSKNGMFKIQKRRTTSSKFYVIPNKERLYNKIKLLKIVKPDTLYPIGKRPWAALDEFQIVEKYHSMYLGLVGHYIKCNSLTPLNRLSYIFLYSCAKTIATRKKITTGQVFSKYGKYLKIERKIKDIDTCRSIEFMGLTRIRKEYFKDDNPRPLSITFDPFKIITFWRTTFKLYSLCCICGSDSNIEMHHINSLKSIKKRKPDFNLILKQLNRKQIPVCKSCHICITNGTYDGKSLKDLFSQSLAAL